MLWKHRRALFDKGFEYLNKHREGYRLEFYFKRNYQEAPPARDWIDRVATFLLRVIMGEEKAVVRYFPLSPTQNPIERPPEPQEQTQPPEQPQTTKPQEKDPQNANKAEEKRNPEPPPKSEPPKAEPPKEKKPEGVIVGVAVDGEKPGAELILEPSLRIRHLYLIGKTRTGKTTLIKNLALQDIAAGFGVCFVDPHGDAADDLIGCIPQHRLQDVIYFDPASETCPAFNILRTSFAPPKLTEDIVNVLKMFFGSSWGFRMEHILRYAILTLLHDPEPRTLKDLRTMLVSENYRAELIANIQDEALRDFWELEFANYPSSAVDPIINKLSSFLVPGSPLLKLFSQKENALDFSRIMNEQKILIVNLSKGLLSEDPSRLLGGLIVTGIQQAALGRASMPPEQRKDFHLYLDEFQNFVVESFESILSEAAKYKLFLTLAHQTLGQVPGYLKHGIFGNVATLIAFQISAEDAATVQREMHRPRYLCFSRGFSNWVSKEDYLAWATDILKRRIQKYANHAGEQRPYWFPDSFKKRLEEVLAKLTHPELTLEALRDIIRNTLEPEGIEDKPFFPRLETKELDYPSIDDFINQQPRHAFCRKERAENVTLFRTLPAPDPNPAVKAAVLRAMNTQTTRSTKSSAVNPEDFIHARKEAPRVEPQPAVDEDVPTIPQEEPERPAPASVKEFLQQYPDAQKRLYQVRAKFRDEVAYWHGKLKEIGSTGAYIRHHKEMKPEAAELEWRTYNREWKQNMNAAAAKVSRLLNHNLTLATLHEMFPEYANEKPSPTVEPVAAAPADDIPRRVKKQPTTRTRKKAKPDENITF